MAVCCSGYNQLRPVSDHCPWMPPRRSSRRSSRVAWTTATHCCSALATDYFIACSRCRTLPPTWSQAFVGVTTSHQCYSSCTGCQSGGTLCSRLRGSYISRLLERLPRTLQPTVAFFFYQTVVWCQTLVVAHCGPTPMSCESCLCHEHITNSVTGVSRLLVNCGMTFHLNYGDQDWPPTPSDNLWKLIYLATEVLIVTLLNLSAL